jgi:tetratricopeptide (TPR) repeat protein
LEEGIKKLPKIAWAFKDFIAMIHVSQGQLTKAINICNETLESFPESGTTYNILGRIYFHLGKDRKAKNYLKQSLELLKKEGIRTPNGDNFIQPFRNDMIKETEEALRNLR